MNRKTGCVGREKRTGEKEEGAENTNTKRRKIDEEGRDVNVYPRLTEKVTGNKVERDGLLQGDDWGATCFWFVIRDEWGQRENTSLAERVMAESMGQASRKNNRLLLFPPSAPLLACSPDLSSGFSSPFPSTHPSPSRTSRLARGGDPSQLGETTAGYFQPGTSWLSSNPFGPTRAIFTLPTAHPRSAQFLALRFINMRTRRERQGLIFLLLFFIFIFLFFFFLILHGWLDFNGCRIKGDILDCFWNFC